MIGKRLLPLLAAVPLILVLPSRAQLQLKSCTVAGAAAQCGVFNVLEDRARPKGRKIALDTIILPQTSADPPQDPLFLLDGGPGSAATQLAGFVVSALAPIRVNHAIVLMDQRGTSGATLLTCEVAEQHFVVPRELSACLARLSSHADLSKYGSLNFVQDIEDLRHALGYRHIHLYGASYGSRVAQLYLREHPDVVRSVVMAAPAPMNLIVPDGLGAGSDEALAQIVKDCRLNASCAAAFPTLQAVPKSLDDFTRIGLHLQMYSPETAQRIPWLLAQSTAGHSRIVRWRLEQARNNLSHSIALGLHLTVICSEDLPLARESGGPFAAEYRQACHDWPRFPAPAHLHDPVTSKVPVLLLTGEFDPVTGPKRADELRQFFPNAQLVVVPGGAHMFGGFSGCIDLIIARFLEEQPWDSTCLAKLPKAQYFLGN